MKWTKPFKPPLVRPEQGVWLRYPVDVPQQDVSVSFINRVLESEQQETVQDVMLEFDPQQAEWLPKLVRLRLAELHGRYIFGPNQKVEMLVKCEPGETPQETTARAFEQLQNMIAEASDIPLDYKKKSKIAKQVDPNEQILVDKHIRGRRKSEKHKFAQEAIPLSRKKGLE
jgi:hypothetical protein